MQNRSAMFRSLLCMLALFLCSTACPATEQQHVLVLNSYNKGYRWTDQQSEKILAQLQKDAPAAIYDVMYMDWKRYPSQATLDDLEQLFHHRYANKRLDLIITTDDAALIFALKFRKKSGLSIPVVYCGVFASSAKEITAGEQDVTGVYEEVDPKGTMEFARKLNPAYQTAYVVHDSSESSIALKEEVKRAAAQLHPPMQIETLADLSFPEIKARIGTLPEDSFVLLASYSRDKNGLVKLSEDFAREFSASANVPVFAMYDHLLGHGVIGGMLLSGELQGEAAARLGISILKGVPISSLPPIEQKTVFPAIDYAEAQRLSIDISNLPANVVIYGKPFSFYEAYRPLVIGVALIVTVLLILVLVLVYNVTQRKRSQAQLESSLLELERSRANLMESEANFRESITFIPMPIGIADAAGSVNFFNIAFVSTFGYEVSDTPTLESWFIRVYPDPSRRHAYREIWDADVAKAMATNTPTPPREYLITTKSGETRDALITMRAVGQWFVAVFEDVTERNKANRELAEHRDHLEMLVAARTNELEHKNTELENALSILQKAQDQLIQTSKLASLGEVVAGVSHELNTPIGNARTVATSLIEQSVEFKQTYFGDQAHALSKSALLQFISDIEHGNQLIDGSLVRAVELIRSFKQVAVDRTSSQRRVFLLADAIKEVIATYVAMLRKSSVHIAVNVPRDLSLDSFPGPLGQIVINLIENAIIHGFHDKSGGNIEISANRTDDMVEMTVTDNGAGISKENVGRVFDPFFTTRLGRGSGLGLNIVYNIVTGLLGGTITVESSIGTGTCFTIRLPLVAPVAPASTEINDRSIPMVA